MNLYTLHLRNLFLACLLTGGCSAYCQDTSAITYSFDPLLLYRDTNFVFTIKTEPPFDYLHRSPDGDDEKTFKEYSYLLNQEPTLQNHEKYFELACALWELNKPKEAERLFLNIIHSAGKYYATTYYHSSDIPGDTTTNLYGYGSFTSNYKHSAAMYLTKIYIEQKKCSQAFRYLEDAVKKYEVVYTCGTGYYAQKDVYDFLYARCYEGLQKYTAALELLLPGCLGRQDEIIIRVIKKLYAPARIKAYLLTAEKSLRYVPDTLPSYAYQTRYNSADQTEKTDTITYYSGTATISLFGRTITIPRPWLEDGERMTKEHFIKEFKESSFYMELAGISAPETEVSQVRR
jgi:hypothetical protein